MHSFQIIHISYHFSFRRKLEHKRSNSLNHKKMYFLEYFVVFSALLRFTVAAPTTQVSVSVTSTAPSSTSLAIVTRKPVSSTPTHRHTDLTHLTSFLDGVIKSIKDSKASKTLSTVVMSATPTYTHRLDDPAIKDVVASFLKDIKPSATPRPSWPWDIPGLKEFMDKNAKEFKASKTLTTVVVPAVPSVTHRLDDPALKDVVASFLKDTKPSASPRPFWPWDIPGLKEFMHNSVEDFKPSATPRALHAAEKIAEEFAAAKASRLHGRSGWYQPLDVVNDIAEEFAAAKASGLPAPPSKENKRCWKCIFNCAACN
ncbi:hypothetical protein FB567DRAFT_337703 [Paraphoma chrysanthemicola]|uniref:Uncharacterized protein n=1 Tax=Paraphoma chrysanthemicola TaxID=798071 RepID=A0A8K0VZR6_9PLEO|nr:hypothetical protein FB567DRAFT_337703 [Paraphoma chrysanthemicola]